MVVAREAVLVVRLEEEVVREVVQVVGLAVEVVRLVVVREAQVVAEWEVLVASAVQAVGWAADWSVCRSRSR